MPNLALLALASLVLLAAWVLRRHRAPVLAIGLAGVAILWPALLIRDGIPSSSRMLRVQAPWSEAIPPGPVQPGLTDVSWQVEPWLLFLRHEVRDGRWPWWNPHQSSGAPYWSNGSAAPAFPLHLLFVVLPLQLGFLVLPWVRVAIGGYGAWRLARRFGVDETAALWAALAWPLCGRLVSFLLYPMGNALCLVPWIVLATDGLASARRGAWPVLVGLATLQLAAGHPETAVFTAVACGIYLLVLRPAPRVVGLLVAAWAVALLVAAPALLPLAFTLFETARWQAWTPGPPLPWATLLEVWLRGLLPDLMGHPLAGGYFGSVPFVPSAVYAGAATVPLAVAGVVQSLGDRRWRALGVAAVFCFLGGYGLPGARHLLLLLPVIRKSVHHYLLLGALLGLVLFAARGLDGFLRGDRRGLAAGTVLAGLAIVAAALWRGPGWVEHRIVASQALPAALALGTPLVLLLAPRSLPVRRVALAATVVLGLDLAWANGRSNPALAMGELWPRTPAIEFLQSREGRVAGLASALRPNAAMVYGLDDARGDDSLKLARYEGEVMDALGAGHATYFQPIRVWDHPWLDELGVRWVVGRPGGESPVASWRVAYEGADARIYERPGARPLVRWEDGGDEGIRVIERTSSRWLLEVETAAVRRLVVAAVWDPGWSVSVDGGPRARPPLVDGVLMGLDVEGGGRRLVELRYRPRGFLVGLLLQVITLAGGLAVWRVRRRAVVEPRARTPLL